MSGERFITSEEVARHSKIEDCWIVLGEVGAKKVYDVTEFLSSHPGGEIVILACAGRDAEKEFALAGHSQTAVVERNKYLIGTLATRASIPAGQLARSPEVKAVYSDSDDDTKGIRTNTNSSSSSSNIADVDKSKALYTAAEVAEHRSETDCWIILGKEGAKKVYDVSKFLVEHPGGDAIIMNDAGQDAEDEYQAVGHSRKADRMMGKYCIGDLCSAEASMTMKETQTGRAVQSATLGTSSQGEEQEHS